MAKLHRDPSPTATDVMYCEWGFDPYCSQTDFARIIPVNPLAKKAFRAVAHKFATKSDWMASSRKFIQFSDYTQNGETVGYYRLDMADIPKSFLWMMGSGSPRAPERVHFILTVSPNKHGVAERHCYFGHHPHSDILLVRARSEVIIDGKDLLVAAGEDTRAVDPTMGIAVGDLMYRIEFTEYSRSAAYTKQVKALHPGRPRDLPAFATPTPATKTLDQWRVYDATYGGVTSTVCFGYKARTGDLVAVKCMKRNSLSVEDISNEIRMRRRVNHVGATHQFRRHLC